MKDASITCSSHIALEAERFVHGTPSGIDPVISTYGGFLLFHKEKRFTPSDVDMEIPLLIGDTEVARSTGDLVATVRERLKRYPSIVSYIIKAGGKLTNHAVEFLRINDLETPSVTMHACVTIAFLNRTL